VDLEQVGQVRADLAAAALGVTADAARGEHRGALRDDLGVLGARGEQLLGDVDAAAGGPALVAGLPARERDPVLLAGAPAQCTTLSYAKYRNANANVAANTALHQPGNGLSYSWIPS
jgi:hypothetical protein